MSLRDSQRDILNRSSGFNMVYGTLIVSYMDMTIEQGDKDATGMCRGMEIVTVGVLHCGANLDCANVLACVNGVTQATDYGKVNYKKLDKNYPKNIIRLFNGAADRQ